MKNYILSIFVICSLFTSSLFAQPWESLETGTEYILFDMSIPPNQSEVIYAAGMQYTWDAEGIIVKSEDGGDSWTEIYGGSGATGLEAICFTSVDTGYIAGWDGYIAKTTDGGLSWVNMNAGIENWFFMDIEFFDGENGVALANLNSGESGVYVTSNAGQNWVLASGINQNVQDLAYANQYTVYAVGADEKISKSIDGGNSFTQIYSGQAQRFFMGCDFDNDFGVIGGEDGKIFSTIDAGENWSTFATGYHNFQGVHVFNVDSAYIGGTDEDVYKTSDSGANWVLEDNGAGQSHIYKVKFATDGTGFLCGSQGMMKRKEAPEIVIVDFEADNTLICTWEQVHFTDVSIGSIDSWEWYFEGGNPASSNEQNPSVYFTTPGIYSVRLTITSNGQPYEIQKEDYITSDYCPGYSELAKNQISISPNPAITQIHINGLDGEKAHIKIYDLTGKLIYEKNDVVSVLDVSDIGGGLYLLIIEINGEFQQMEFVIE